MTISVTMTCYAKDVMALPYDKEVELVTQKLAALRAELVAAGVTVSVCSVNGNDVPASE